jgi:hypothetical protein
MIRLLTHVCAGVQTSDAAEVEAIKAGVAVLKRVCRQRTTVAWKDWRHSVEEQKRVALQVVLFLTHTRAHIVSTLPAWP